MSQKKLIDDVILDIPEAVLASELPDTVIATVKKIEKVLGDYGPSLAYTLETDNKVKVTTHYRIPKSRTGKGQMDIL